MPLGGTGFKKSSSFDFIQYATLYFVNLREFALERVGWVPGNQFPFDALIGYRAIAFICNDETRLVFRRQNNLSAKFSELQSV